MSVQEFFNCSRVTITTLLGANIVEEGNCVYNVNLLLVSVFIILFYCTTFIGIQLVDWVIRKCYQTGKEDKLKFIRKFQFFSVRKGEK